MAISIDDLLSSMRGDDGRAAALLEAALEDREEFGHDPGLSRLSAEDENAECSDDGWKFERLQGTDEIEIERMMSSQEVSLSQSPPAGSSDESRGAPSSIDLSKEDRKIISAPGTKAEPHSSPVSSTATATNHPRKLKDSVDPLWSSEDLARKTRKEALERFRMKRALRSFNKTIRYQCRRNIADERPRVNGRFVKADHVIRNRKPDVKSV